jgi:hypothetical protein
VSGGKGMVCKNAFGTETSSSLTSCLKGGGPGPSPPSPTPSPGPIPKPTPAAPTPAPPAGCDVDGCLQYCVAKYGGSIGDQGPTYMCSKVRLTRAFALADGDVCH